jgi:hypothetical protein
VLVVLLSLVNLQFIHSLQQSLATKIIINNPQINKIKMQSTRGPETSSRQKSYAISYSNATLEGLSLNLSQRKLKII